MTDPMKEREWKKRILKKKFLCPGLAYETVKMCTYDTWGGRGQCYTPLYFLFSWQKKIKEDIRIMSNSTSFTYVCSDPPPPLRGGWRHCGLALSGRGGRMSLAAVRWGGGEDSSPLQRWRERGGGVKVFHRRLLNAFLIYLWFIYLGPAPGVGTGAWDPPTAALAAAFCFSIVQSNV